MADQTFRSPLSASPTRNAKHLVAGFASRLRIAHQISGRVRIKIAPALDTAALGQGASLGKILALLPGVRGIQLNPLARSCVVEYDHRAIPDAAWPDLLAGRSSAAAQVLLDLLDQALEDGSSDHSRDAPPPNHQARQPDPGDSGMPTGKAARSPDRPGGVTTSSH